MLLTFTMLAFSQNDVTKKYYSDKYCNKVSTEQKGKYLEISSKLNDSISQIEFICLKTNTTLWRINQLRNHPYGICRYFKDNGELDHELNYNFVLKYGEFVPVRYSEIDLKSKNLKNNTNGTFEMPVIEGNYNDILQYVVRNFRYPQYAIENRIEGKVLAQFTIDKNGKIENISIVRGVQESVDWEVCRIIHSMQILKPAKLDGKNIDVYMIVPVVFKLN